MYIIITPLFYLSLLTQLSYASRHQLSPFHALSKTILFTISPAYSNYIYLTPQSSTFPCVHHMNSVVVCSTFANHIAARPFSPSVIDSNQSTVSSVEASVSDILRLIQICSNLLGRRISDCSNFRSAFAVLMIGSINMKIRWCAGRLLCLINLKTCVGHRDDFFLVLMQLMVGPATRIG